MKLSAKDLMVGDWVMYDGEPNIITELSEIIHEEATVCFVGNNYMANIDEIKPIPLTPEILEKNGFYWGYPVDVEEMASNVFGGIGIEMPPKSWVWDEGDGVISIIFPNESDGGVFTCYLDKHLTLVFDDEIFAHQLQHALKLCGIEKEIIL